MTCERFQFDPVYLEAAARGNATAQAALAGCLMGQARGATDAETNELLAGAEVFAMLAAQSLVPVNVATLGMVRFCRARAMLDSDPLRSAAYREDANVLFDALTELGDPDALEVVARTLTMFAEHDDDEAAAMRLGSVIERLPPERAVMLREWSREREETAALSPVQETR